ncbi:hypothetical protein [Xanthobacter versatilis]|uniref:hypothetical protein n=1 Tax=Xanthobacter autotrophicus (strain ATCC BAA-1158 / Py2) TaxID=78245 RepID=UPI00372898AD
MTAGQHAAVRAAEENAVQDSEEKLNRDQSLMCLGRHDAVALFLLYFVTLCLGLYYLITLMVKINEINIPDEYHIVSILITSSLCGSSIFYARKLYKAGINNDYNFYPSEFNVSRISTIAFFIIRIPTACIFSIVIYSLWRLTLSISINEPFKASSSSMYLFVSMGFFSGFSAGKIVSYFERDGIHLIQTGGRSDG